MSAQEIQSLTQRFADAFTSKNMKAVVDMLDEDVEVFDHVPYRFDGKAEFATYLTAAAEGNASMEFDFRQPSCRMLSDTTGVMNAYDSSTGATNDGKKHTIHGRTTLVFVKRAGQWKIVSAHFSALPHAA